nr:reverse transcriptase domain-containing protein [Tanacetum cinerariifolium]
MSTSTHPIIILFDSDVEDAFSSTTTPNYISVSPNYFPASPGNISFDSSEDLSKDHSASLAILPFHDDPYMKVMQSYNDTSNESPILLPRALIAPPTVLPPFLVLLETDTIKKDKIQAKPDKTEQKTESVKNLVGIKTRGSFGAAPDLLKAWDTFKDLLRACPHHGFSELHQLDTFYNALNSKDQDSLNSAAGVVAKVSTNTSTSGISPYVAELKDMLKPLLLDKKSQNQSPAHVKAVKESCVSKEDFSAYVKANDAFMRNMHTQGQNMQNQLTNLTNLITKFVNSNSASTSSLGTHPSNIIANPGSDLKAITTRSGMFYDGPQIPPSLFFLPKVVENEPKATKDTVHPTNNESTEDVQPQVVHSESQILNSELVTYLISEPVISLVSALKHNPKSSIPYPSRRHDERNREKANNQIEKFYQIFKDMSFEITKVKSYYNARVRDVTFRPGDFVYRSNDANHAVAGGKLGPKWERPYDVTHALGDGAYKLRSMDGTVLSRTWNIDNLKRCYL